MLHSDSNKVENCCKGGCTSQHLIWVILELLQAIFFVHFQGMHSPPAHSQLAFWDCSTPSVIPQLSCKDYYDSVISVMLFEAYQMTVFQ